MVTDKDEVLAAGKKRGLTSESTLIHALLQNAPPSKTRYSERPEPCEPFQGGFGGHLVNKNAQIVQVETAHKTKETCRAHEAFPVCISVENSPIL